MPLSSPPVAPPSLARASSLPRRLSFSHDAARLQFAAAMKDVQQYLGTHLPDEHLALLGVNDSRSRYYFDEIQQFLAHHRGARGEQEQMQQQRTAHQPERCRRDSDLLLLQDIDAFLDELDPSLFASDADAAATSWSTESMPATTIAAPSSRLKRSCSYIQEMQALAFASKKPRAVLLTE